MLNVSFLKSEIHSVDAFVASGKVSLFMQARIPRHGGTNGLQVHASGSELIRRQIGENSRGYNHPVMCNNCRILLVHSGVATGG